VKLQITPTNREIQLAENDIIVSKTDLTGRITYANRTFMRIANFSERELLNQQHNIIRHPDMPRGGFRLLWDTLKNGQEFFAYVKNMTSDGDYYWVFANITPDLDSDGKVAGYFSVRRKPKDSAIQAIIPVYQQMLEVERKAGPADAPMASIRFLQDILSRQGTTYDRFILGLQSA
jgi:PAS domain S-box-containing protein